MVAQEEVKGVRILAPEEVRWHKPDEQRYFKDQESQKTIKKEGPGEADQLHRRVFFANLLFEGCVRSRYCQGGCARGS